MKILNLYAGIGGNRKLWGNEHEVTAVENDQDIAKVYKDLYKQDTVLVTDAHQYLLDHFQEFDFIWSSPPCPSHSQYRFNVGFKAKGFTPLYPDMKLYEEILLLKHYFSGNWAIENTISYYEPLVKPTKVSRHYFWSNKPIRNIKVEVTGIGDKNKISDLEEFLGFDLSSYKLKNKRQILRNCVNPQLGLHVFNEVNNPNQLSP